LRLLAHTTAQVLIMPPTNVQSDTEKVEYVVHDNAGRPFCVVISGIAPGQSTSLVLDNVDVKVYLHSLDCGEDIDDEDCDSKTSHVVDREVIACSGEKVFVGYDLEVG
jgi:hypothetical protein